MKIFSIPAADVGKQAARGKAGEKGVHFWPGSVARGGEMRGNLGVDFVHVFRFVCGGVIWRRGWGTSWERGRLLS